MSATAAAAAGAAATTWRSRALRVVPPLILVAHALAFVAALAVLHALGARDAVSILSGTAPADHAPNVLSTFLGLGYVLAWFASVVLGPVLVLAALLHVLLGKLSARRGA